MASINFSGETTSITIQALGGLVTTGISGNNVETTTSNDSIFRVFSTGSTAPVYPMDPAYELNDVSQIQTDKMCIAFSENYNQYNVAYFFSASSLNVTSCTFEYITGSTIPGGAPHFDDGVLDSGWCIDNVIYEISDAGVTDVYAVRVTIPELYSQTLPNNSYIFNLHLSTNDPEIIYDQNLTIGQTGCQTT